MIPVVITKEFFDKTIPDTNTMWELASKIIGVDLANGYRCAVAWRVHTGLEWLAKATELTRLVDTLTLEGPGLLRAYGLQFKPSDLKIEGSEDWPVGTTCWYVLIGNYGHRWSHQWFACAETQHLAVLRGIVLMHALALDLSIAPHLRHKSISETIQQIVANFIANEGR